YALSPHTKNPHSLDSWAFYFQNAAGNRDVLKVEINYSMREHIFPTEKRKIKSEILNADFQINTLAEIELFGSKIKALIERAAARDLYDVHNIINHNAVNSDNKELLRKIIIFYLTVGGKNEIILPFTFENINKLKFPKIRSTLVPVLRKSENFDFETAKTEVINFLADLMKLPKNEIDFIKKFEQGIYQPELLFDDAQIIARIKEHPMAIWRTKNIK
ncbi:MAG: nucleotidyl transferase AbiEii/AbiGii toxin family protein, partial [Paludibacter sp.]|nr:nucleotidyl transferase AbiEii/AbiGii toxin family protein [Paludibacter sp.]